MKIIPNLLVLSSLIGVLMVLNSFNACIEDEHSPTPTATPTITPTPTPTGNAPQLLYPIDGEQISSPAITFDWSDSIGATKYWFALWVWYPAGETGSWLPLWDNTFRECSGSQLTLTRAEIWFYWQNDSYNWISGDYAWAVQGDTSSCWSETGYFSWLE